MINIEKTGATLAILFENMRSEDKSELEYFFKSNTKEKFIDICLDDKNDTYILGLDNKTPLAIGGVYTHYIEDYKFGQVWLLCANAYQKRKLCLYKYIFEKIKTFLCEYDILFNFIYKTNFSAITWLKKMGFSFVELNNKDFRLFYLKKGGFEYDLRYFTCE